MAAAAIGATAAGDYGLKSIVFFEVTNFMAAL